MVAYFALRLTLRAERALSVSPLIFLNDSQIREEFIRPSEYFRLLCHPDAVHLRVIILLGKGADFDFVT
jgi:hypothetical protein